MDKARQAYFEKKIEDEGDKFIVFFLYDDEDQNAHVEEVEKVDFFEVVQHLNLGGSVFITHRKKPKHNVISPKNFEELKKPWFFNRI